MDEKKKKNKRQRKETGGETDELHGHQFTKNPKLVKSPCSSSLVAPRTSAHQVLWEQSDQFNGDVTANFSLSNPA